MKIVCFADTHTQHSRIQSMPSGDVLICAGDFEARHGQSVAEFNEWLGRFSHPHKIVIAGNHDWLFEKDPIRARSMITNAIYLEDSGCEIDGVKFWGSPITPNFMQWAFNRGRGKEIREHWDMIPNDTNVLITHGPPQGICDTTRHDGEHLGCADLAGTIDDRLQPAGNLKTVIFGHIHGGYGRYEYRGVQYINCSTCDEGYRPINEPQVIEINV